MIILEFTGRSQDGSRCRHCSEYETLPHVLGFCSKGYVLRIARHNQIRSLIAESLRKMGLTVVEEMICNATNGSIRRFDILAMDKNTHIGWIVDPTIRFEMNVQQADEVNKEKQSIYESCIPDVMIKYKLKNVKVIGLFIGARGTITRFFEDFRELFRLPKSLSEEIALTALKTSIQILNHHLYAPNL